MAKPRMNWTQSAIECYKRGGICEGCPTKELISSQKCQMKKTIIKLVATIGKPPKDFIGFFPGITPTQNEIINAIITGADTADEIAELIGISIASAQYKISQICNLAEVNGLSFKKKRGRLPELIKYLRTKAISEEKEENIMFDEDLQIKYANFLKPLVDSIKSGYESYDDLIKYSNLTKHQISVYWTNLLNLLLKEGLLVRNPEKTQKQEIIDFIRNRLIDVQNGNITPTQTPVPKLKKKIEIKPISHNVNECNSEKSGTDKNLLINQPLTKTENTVLEMLFQGLNYQQIAEKIPISITTVKTHIANIFKKRNYHSLQELLFNEFIKNKQSMQETCKNNRLEEELNATKLLLEGKNNQYVAALNDTVRLQKENEQLQKRIEELENRPVVNINFEVLKNKIKTEMITLSQKMSIICELEKEIFGTPELIGGAECTQN